jgi:hypothetical protein
MRVITMTTIMAAVTAVDQLMDITDPTTAADIIGDGHTATTIMEMAVDALISTTDIIDANITGDPILNMTNTTDTMMIDIRMAL